MNTAQLQKLDASHQPPTLPLQAAWIWKINRWRDNSSHPPRHDGAWRLLWFTSCIVGSSVHRHAKMRRSLEDLIFVLDDQPLCDLDLVEQFSDPILWQELSHPKRSQNSWKVKARNLALAAEISCSLVIGKQLSLPAIRAHRDRFVAAHFA